MRKALFAGTFEPPSLGHLDIITRAKSVCDELYVGITTNIVKPKETLFSVQEKVELFKEFTAHLSYVKVVSFEGLVIEYAKKEKIQFLIRGLRSSADFEYEWQMAVANRSIGGVDTLFLLADKQYAPISSSLIRELAHYKASLRDFVPPSVEKKIYERLSIRP